MAIRASAGAAKPAGAPFHAPYASAYGDGYPPNRRTAIVARCELPAD
jgi:hypothetical protein